MDPLFVASAHIALRSDFSDHLPVIADDLRLIIETRRRSRSNRGRHALADALGLMFPQSAYRRSKRLDYGHVDSAL